MKKITSNTVKNSAIALFMLLTIGATNSVFANSTNPIVENPSEVKYIGTIQNKPLFELNLNNTSSEKFLVIVKDATGNELYSEKVSGVNISKKYCISAEDELVFDSDFGIEFSVTSLKTKKTQYYKVSSRTELVKEFEIAAK